MSTREADRIKKIEKRVIGKSSSGLRRKWRRWLPRLRNDVTDLYHKLQIYKELVEVIKSNAATIDPPVFFNWMRDNYVVAICIGIRRLSDSDVRSISIRILLDEIAMRPETLSRESYRALHWRKGLTSRDADVSFDIIVGTGRAYVSKHVVNEDKSSLMEVDMKIRRLVNKRLAHHAPLTQAGKPPTFDELEEALEVFDKLLAKYNSLITGDSLVTLYSNPQYDWRKAIQVPWMSNDPRQRPSRYNGPEHPVIFRRRDCE
ncbi:MAG: hypothetical protein R8K22_03460 [Mariprofundaceae bacterium]